VASWFVKDTVVLSGKRSFNTVVEDAVVLRLYRGCITVVDIAVAYSRLYGTRMLSAVCTVLGAAVSRVTEGLVWKKQKKFMNLQIADFFFSPLQTQISVPHFISRCISVI
jgi:hypothetical protein